MLKRIRDWWRGYSDADMQRVLSWGADRPVPAQMTEGEYWACLALWVRTRPLQAMRAMQDL